MDRAKVILHMYTTMDGKIETSIPSYPDCDEAGEIYDRFTFDRSKAWGCGSRTFEYLSAQGVDLHKSEPRPLGVDEFRKADRYCFAFDRKGRLFFQEAFNDYGGEKSHFVSVLTEKVDPRFLGYLHQKGISYLFAGKEDFDPRLFLAKVKEQGIDTFLLCGGPEINSVFLKEDLVDEISLVICPGIQGGRKELTFVGTEDVSLFPKFFHVEKAEVLPGDTVHLVYRR